MVSFLHRAPKLSEGLVRGMFSCMQGMQSLYFTALKTCRRLSSQQTAWALTEGYMTPYQRVLCWRMHRSFSCLRQPG